MAIRLVNEISCEALRPRFRGCRPAPSSGRCCGRTCGRTLSTPFFPSFRTTERHALQQSLRHSSQEVLHRSPSLRTGLRESANNRGLSIFLISTFFISIFSPRPTRARRALQQDRTEKAEHSILENPSTGDVSQSYIPESLPASIEVFFFVVSRSAGLS